MLTRRGSGWCDSSFTSSTCNPGLSVFGSVLFGSLFDWQNDKCVCHTETVYYIIWFIDYMYSNQIAQICANSICSLDFIRSVCFLFIPTWPRHYGSSSQSLNDLQRFVELVKILRLLTCGGTSSPALGAKPRRAIHFLCFKVVQPERLKQLVTTSGNWIWWILIRKPWCNDAFDSHLAVVRSRSCITWQIAGMPRKTIRIEAAHLLPGMELEKTWNLRIRANSVASARLVDQLSWILKAQAMRTSTNI